MITMQRVNKARPIWEIARNDVVLVRRRSSAAALKNFCKIRDMYPGEHTFISEAMPRE